MRKHPPIIDWVFRSGGKTRLIGFGAARKREIVRMVEVYCHPGEIPIADAMLVWTRGERVGVVPHPDTMGLSDQFQSSVGACFAYWRGLDARGQKLQLMIEAWHVAAFYDIPAHALHEAMLCIPEYREMLASDCLPDRFRHERD